MANVDEMMRVNKEIAQLEPTVTAYDQYMTLSRDLDEAKEIIAESDDDDLREMVRFSELQFRQHLKRFGVLIFLTEAVAAVHISNFYPSKFAGVQVVENGNQDGAT